MSRNVIVRKVEDKQDYRDFFEFPWALYKDDPNWIPPLKSIRSDTLNKDKNPAWEYLEGDYFTAWKDGEIAGTIAAFVNHHHNEFQNEHISWFGVFETINDEDVAHALLQTAVEWGKSRGYDAVRGPQSFTTWEECGLLIDGFEPPFFLMPYNPPYYQKLVESAGLHKVMDTYSFYYDWQIIRDTGTEKRMKRIVERVKRNNNFRIRPIDRKNLRREFEHFRDITNQAWSENWGFTPMTERELDELVKGLGMIFDPNLACFVVDGDEPIGFFLGAPDFNQVLQLAHPHPRVPEPITLLKVIWYWKIRNKINRFRVPLMGVKKAYRMKGVDVMLYDYMLNELPKLATNYQSMDGGWILETNMDMMGVAKGFNLKIHRRYRFYEKALK